jgi:hypothetical protein
MKRWGKGLLWTLLVLALGVGLGLFALQRWVASDDFRTRVQAQAETMLGVPVALGRLHIDPWPVPAVALEAVEVRTQPALTARHIELRLQLRALLAGQLTVASLVLQGADLPQPGIDQLLAALRGSDGDASAKTRAEGTQSPGISPAQPLLLLPRRLTLDDVTWRNNRGEATTLDATATLDEHGLPDKVELKLRAGAFQGALAQATRQVPGSQTGSQVGLQAGAQGDSQAGAQGDSQASAQAGSQTASQTSQGGDLAWVLQVQHAGGTINGVLQVRDPARDPSTLSVQGRFETRNLELSLLRRGAPGPLSGRMRASTTLRAEAADTAGLAQALVSQSSFTVDDAVVQGVDLARAVKTVGLSRGGLTRLDTLSGQVATRGQSIRLSQLAASSGALSATGDVTVAPNRSLSGRVTVNLAEKVVGKAVGVPLVVGGTLDAPTVTLTRGAMLGAAIGTLVMPGVGTGAGASFGDAIGDKLKGLFGK